MDVFALRRTRRGKIIGKNGGSENDRAYNSFYLANSMAALRLAMPPDKVVMSPSRSPAEAGS